MYKTPHQSIGANAMKEESTLYLVLDFTLPKTKAPPSTLGQTEKPSALPNKSAAI